MYTRPYNPLTICIIDKGTLNKPYGPGTLDLVKQVEINIDYILALVTECHEGYCDNHQQSDCCQCVRFQTASSAQFFNPHHNQE